MTYKKCRSQKLIRKTCWLAEGIAFLMVGFWWLDLRFFGASSGEHAPSCLFRRQSPVLLPLFTAVGFLGGRCVGFTRQCFLSDLGARGGFNPCVFRRVWWG
jgi:hypothetical protein